MAKPLTPKERQFVAEYLIDRNGAKAAIRAGYRQSRAAARVTASRLLRKANVRASLDEKLKQAQEKALVDAGYVIQKLRDVAEHCTQDGRIWDHSGAVGALKLLGQHLKLFTEKHEVSGADGQPIVLQWEDPK